MGLGNAYVEIDRRSDNLLRYDPETITIPAGETRELVGVCSFVEILSATIDNALVSFNNSFFFPLDVGLIWAAPEGLAIRRLYIKNPGGVAVTYEVAKGIGNFVDNRLVLSSTSSIISNPVPSAYSGLANAIGVVGSGYINTVVVAAGANLNGILVYAANAACLADPTADYYLAAGALSLVRAYDSQTASLAGMVVVPAGVALSTNQKGGGTLSVAYRVL